MKLRTHHFLCGLILTCVACKPTPPAVPAVAVADIGHAHDATKDAGPAFSGSPVAVTPLVELHQAEGFVFSQQRWRFDGDEGVAWLVRVDTDASVRVASSAHVVPFADLLPNSSGPWAAINGGFYEAIPNTPNFRAMGLVVSDGTEASKLTARGGSGVFFVDADGPQVVHRKDYSGGATQALQSIDRLIDKNASVVTRRPGKPRAMRSAVAVSDDAVWLVALASSADITVEPDGVQLARTGAGLPLWAFAEYVLAATDAREALNLDGGVSTQLAVRDGDYRFDVKGVRGTINAVVVQPR